MSKKRKKNDTKETKVEDKSDSNQEMKTGDESEKDDKKKTPKVKPESLMKDWKKKHSISEEICTKTVTCSLNRLLINDYIGEKIESAVTYVTKIKSKASLFANWYVLDCLENGSDLNIDFTLNSGYTPFFQCVWGKPPNEHFKTTWNRYSKETGQLPIPNQSGFSQTIEFAKGEMVSKTVTNIYLNFYKRLIQIIRWFLADMFGTFILSLESKKDQKKLIYDLSSIVLKAIKTESFNLEECEAKILSLLGTEYLRDQLIEFILRERGKYYDMINQCFEIKKVKDEKAAKKKEEKKDQEEKKPKRPRKQTTTPYDVSVETLLKYVPNAGLSYLFRLTKEANALDLTKEWNDLGIKDDDNFKPNTKWKFWKSLRLPRFTPLPIYSQRRQFIRIDQKQLTEFWKVNEVCESEGWWLSSILDIYGNRMFSKKDRKGIRTLFRWKKHGLTCPKMFKTVCDLDDIGHLPSRHPIIPGASFLTDGVSIKIQLLCFDTHNTIVNLNESGWSGISDDPVDLNHVSKGLYFLDSCYFSGDFQETKFTGIDPGVRKPVAWTSINNPDMLEDRHDLVNEMLQNTRYISEDRYLEKSRSKKDQMREVKRRQINEEYSKAMEHLSTVKKRTFDLKEFTEYVKTRSQTEDVIFKETLDWKRSWFRFLRFRAIQKTLSYVTKKIIGRRMLETKRQREDTDKKHIIFFGASNFSGGGHGHVSIPRKKLVRILSQHVPVVLTNEYCTSKNCPLCLRELNDIKCDKEDPTTIQRFRQWRTKCA